MVLHAGDSVVVKTGVLDPDFGTDISGWQGRIEEIDDGESVFIRWDSITLRNTRLDIIIRCENENLDWEVMTLDTDEVEKTTSRDTEEDVSRTASQQKLKMIGDPRLNAERIRIDCVSEANHNLILWLDKPGPGSKDHI